MTKTQYFRGTNRKGEFLKQLLQKRSRLEYYRLIATPIKETSKAIARKNRIEKFYRETDLFSISDLAKIDSLIHDVNEVEEDLEDELEEELIEQMEIESEQQIFSIQDIPSSSSSNEIDHEYMSAGKKKNILENKKISLGINKLKNQRSNVKNILKNVLFAKK